MHKAAALRIRRRSEKISLHISRQRTRSSALQRGWRILSIWTRWKASSRRNGRVYGDGYDVLRNGHQQALETQITSAMEQIMERLAAGMSDAFTQAMSQIGDVLADAVDIDADAFAEAFEMNMTGEEFTELMMSMSSGQSASYDNNLRTLGYVDFDEPAGIDIYPKDFESKEAVVGILDDYNSRMEAAGQEEKVITYTDMVGTLMSSVTDDHRYHQLCPDRVCGDLAYRVFDHDRGHYLHQRAGAQERDWHPAGDRSVKEKYIAGI